MPSNISGGILRKRTASEKVNVAVARLASYSRQIPQTFSGIRQRAPRSKYPNRYLEESTLINGVQMRLWHQDLIAKLPLSVIGQH